MDEIHARRHSILTPLHGNEWRPIAYSLTTEELIHGLLYKAERGLADFGVIIERLNGLMGYGCLRDTSPLVEILRKLPIPKLKHLEAEALRIAVESHTSDAQAAKWLGIQKRVMSYKLALYPNIRRKK